MGLNPINRSESGKSAPRITAGIAIVGEGLGDGPHLLYTAKREGWPV